MNALWEQDDFQRAAGETWRPGGLALTRRALELGARCCGFAPGARLLDMGCGAGAAAGEAACPMPSPPCMRE